MRPWFAVLISFSVLLWAGSALAGDGPGLRELGEASDMAYVPAGEFWLGCSPGDDYCRADETPRFMLHLDGFWIDRRPVTNAAYDECVRAQGCRSQYDRLCWMWTGTELESRPATTLRPEFKGPDNPVVCVDWRDARAYCEWAGKRLPTEAEWEKAARGGAETVYYWGDEMAPDRAWHAANAGNVTQPVGLKPPNDFGLYDMLGNVWEWAEEWYDAGRYHKLDSGWRDYGIEDQEGWSRVIRGGSWLNPGRMLRVSIRRDHNESSSNFSHGFRCARD